MEKLVESLFSYIELLVLGALAFVLVAYLLAWVTGIKPVLLRYLSELFDFWFGSITNPIDRKVFHWVRIGFGIGALYFLGVVAYVVTWWLVERVSFCMLW